MQEINTLGAQIFAIVLVAGRWIILVSGAVEILRNISNRNFEKAIKALVQSIIVFGAIMLLPIALDMVEAAFQ